MADTDWLELARELQAIAQTGLAYGSGRFDLERYERIRAIAAALLALGSGTEPKRILELFQEDGYATPKVDVRGAAFRDGRILLVREVSDGRWALPGGFADVNQSAVQNVVREIREEAGFDARAVKLAMISDYRRQDGPARLFSIYKLFFVCEITGGEPRPSVETSEVGFFDEGGLPELSTGRTTAAHIERVFRHFRQPALMTEFD
jgi:ADP-ribose pyrophosphatase YjhB (NUDIX family)